MTEQTCACRRNRSACHVCHAAETGSHALAAAEGLLFYFLRPKGHPVFTPFRPFPLGHGRRRYFLSLISRQRPR